MASQLVTTVRNLHQRKGRRRRALALAEGLRLVEEALAANLRVEGALVTPALGDAPRGEALLAALAARAVPLEEVSTRAFAQLADTDTPQGVLAVVAPPQWELSDLRPSRGQPILVLDAVQDPGNVGTLLRTAFSLGAAGAVLLKGTADVANPKVMRAAMGATFRLPTASADEPGFAAWASRARCEVWTAELTGRPLVRAEAPERLALVVGNEGAGVRPAVRALARRHVAIPLARGAESLNVAVAAGILLYALQHGA